MSRHVQTHKCHVYLGKPWQCVSTTTHASLQPAPSIWRGTAQKLFAEPKTKKTRKETTIRFRFFPLRLTKKRCAKKTWKRTRSLQLSGTLGSANPSAGEAGMADGWLLKVYTALPSCSHINIQHCGVYAASLFNLITPIVSTFLKFVYLVPHLSPFIIFRIRRQVHMKAVDAVGSCVNCGGVGF